MNRGVLAFIIAFAIQFAVVGISYALAVPYDPGFDSVPYDPGFPD